MRMYVCLECGGIFEHKDMKWTNRTYDLERLDGMVFPVCPSCGSEDVDSGEVCERCGEAIGDEWLGEVQVCRKCKEAVLDEIEETIDQFAQDRSIDYKTAKEYFLGWSEERW